jgi:hypothetical protein
MTAVGWIATWRQCRTARLSQSPEPSRGGTTNEHEPRMNEPKLALLEWERIVP